MAGDVNLPEQNPSERALSMNQRMEELAVAGDWNEVADLMIQRNAILESVEKPEREAALVAARRTTMRVQRMAENARNDVGEKLSQLQRGKRATDSYLAHA